MYKSINFLDEINNKYAMLESGLDQTLRKIVLDEEKLNKLYPIPPNTESFKSDDCTNLDGAKHRNAYLIKELEMSKARLRSRATYSPLEQVLKKSIRNYYSNISLKPITMFTRK